MVVLVHKNIQIHLYSPYVRSQHAIISCTGCAIIFDRKMVDESRKKRNSPQEDIANFSISFTIQKFSQSTAGLNLCFVYLIS